MLELKARGIAWCGAWRRRSSASTQERDRYAAHVRPVNELVDELHDLDGRGWMPHVAPVHGGVEARVLSVLRDPGPKTQDGVGSPGLCGLRSTSVDGRRVVSV